jgi:hypothetical protein
MTRAIISAAMIATLLPLAAAAQDAKPRTVEQYSCKDVMREHGADRDTAIAFLHGLVLGKTGKSSFDLTKLHKESDAFIERCLDNPTERAIDAMTKVKG